jgi:hypothetical protein
MAGNDSSKDGQRTPSGGAAAAPQLLHLVFGGELEDIESVRFADLAHLDVVGIFPNYRTAYDAWKGKAQATVDNARVPLHRPPHAFDPDATALAPGPIDARWSIRCDRRKEPARSQPRSASTRTPAKAAACKAALDRILRARLPARHRRTRRQLPPLRQLTSPFVHRRVRALHHLNW